MQRPVWWLLSLIVACATPRGTERSESTPLVDALLVLDADVVLVGSVALVSPRRIRGQGRVELFLDHLEVLKGDVPESRRPPIRVYAWVDPSFPAVYPAPSF